MAGVYKSMIHNTSVTRVEVIDENGRSYTKHLDNDQTVCYSIQDHGRTLKVFINKTKEDQVAVDTHQPGTTPLTRVVRKIFNAFKSGPVVHTEQDCSMANSYTNSPLGIPIPYNVKVRYNKEPQEKGSHTINRKRKKKE